MEQWSELEKAPDFKARVKEYKIKVQYLPADDTTAAAPLVNGVEDSTIVDDSVLSPPQTFTPRQHAQESVLARSEEPTPQAAPYDFFLPPSENTC
jgi:hypothetical protein